MSLRSLQIHVDDARGTELRELLESLQDPRPLDVLDVEAAGRTRVDVLLDARDTEALMDRLEDRFGGEPSFRVVVLAVEATLPRPEPEEKATEAPAEEAAPARPDRVSREELYADLESGATPSTGFVLRAALATVVAAVGLLQGNVAVVIGAMVLAPLLGPNVALAFGATLGDLVFVRRALATSAIGMLVAILIAVAIGFAVPVDPTLPEIAARTRVHPGDVALALAAGVAGTLATLSSVSTSLVGVMVAVALLPPLVVAGLLAGAGHGAETGRATMLLAVNVISVNLACVATFVVMGVRPYSWWEREGARRSSRLALLIWAGLLTLVLLWLLRVEVR